MSLSKRLIKFSIMFLILIMAALVAVMLVFKGGKIIDYFTPAPTIATFNLDTPTMGIVKVYEPEAEPEGLVIIAADKAKAKDQTALAKEFAEQNLIAVTLDFDALRLERASRLADVDCHYLSDDLKDAAEAVQRNMSLKKYFFPSIVGLGEAAPFAYAVIAQAPKNTLAGGISVGFSDRLKTDRPYCEGALTEPVRGQDNITEYQLSTKLKDDKELPSPWYVIVTAQEQAKADNFTNAIDKAISITASAGEATDKAVIDTAQELQRQEENGVQSLPVSIIPPQGPTKALVIILSGDGGWRDIDKKIGDKLASKGIAVVGVDSLRYFWSRKEPATIAADIELLFTEYGKQFQTDKYGLAGYSFGANVIPFAWPLISKPTRKQVKLISLLGVAPNTDFEVSVEGYLGSTSDTAEAVKPYLEKMPMQQTQCFYGKEETEEDKTACTFPEFDKAERIMTEGGHHFDGDYDALADRISNRLLSAQP
ncbi:AcvB/VirJ family lysyl-phosphatidylglycerol hydrolase [Microvirga sp. W0021]|uniref:AcvB/VirJ family lysyl-phosphatidylglycerol hydrolase n=1 Tax=Hohaiivirga grylli TaxID=3133970 RepID=A0ABV0BKJ7_9HYPH